MLKPDSLRAHLTDNLDTFRDQADRLDIFIDKGSVRSTGQPLPGGAVAFEYRYTLIVRALDLAEHPDVVFAAVLGWAASNQVDLLQNTDKNAVGIPFEVDVLDGGKIDLEIQMELTEAVRAVRKTDGKGFDLVHAPEPSIAGADEWAGVVEPIAPLTGFWIRDQMVTEGG